MQGAVLHFGDRTGHGERLRALNARPTTCLDVRHSLEGFIGPLSLLISFGPAPSTGIALPFFILPPSTFILSSRACVRSDERSGYEFRPLGHGLLRFSSAGLVLIRIV